MENSNLQITEQIKSHLNETAKWGKFLAILGFIGIGLMVLLAIFMGTFMSALSAMPGADSGMPIAGMGGMMSSIYIIMAIIYFFPTYYLFKFSNKMQSALNLDNNDDLQEAFLNLKSCYKFIGILYIILISIYLLILIGALILGALA